MRLALQEPRNLALIDQALVSGCNFLSVLYIGRHLPAAEFGLFSLALLSTVFLGNMHRAAITQPMNVLGSGEKPGAVTARLVTLLRAHALAIPLAVLVVWQLSTHFFPDNAVMLSCALFIGCSFFQETLRRYWYTLNRLDKALMNDALAYGGRMLLLLAAETLHGFSGADVFILMAAPTLLAFLLGARELRRSDTGTPPPMKAVARQHWQLSRWLIPTVLAVWGASQIYPFLLAGLGPVAVASFMACRNLLSATTVVVQSVDNYLPVRAAALLRQQGREAFKRHLLRTLAYTAGGGLVFVCVMLLAARPLLSLMYQGTYDGAADILRILPLGTVSMLLGTVLGAYSLAMQDSRASFLANLGATAVTLTIGIWLVWHQGLEGAAFATVLTATTSMLLQGALVAARLQQLPDLEATHA